MKYNYLSIEKVVIVCAFIIFGLDLMPSLEIPLVALLIPFIILGMLRGAIVTLLILMNVFGCIDEKIEAYRLKNKN